MGRVNEAFGWWFLRPKDSLLHRFARFAVGGLLWGWFIYELLLGIARWLQFVRASFWWLPAFPVVIPLLSLQAVPSLMMALLVPVVLTGPDSTATRVGVTAACCVLAAALAAALPVVQHYVELFFLFWF